MPGIDRAALRAVLEDIREEVEGYLIELKVAAHDSIGVDTTAAEVAHGKGLTDGVSHLMAFLEDLAEPLPEE